MRETACTSKNNGIVIWRVFFAYWIAIYHLTNAYEKATGFYMATDFFFIVSGFLLAKDASEHRFENAFQMLKHKIKKLYPHYFLSLFIGWILFSTLKRGPCVSKGGLLLEAGMLQMVGVNLTEMINVPTWYISVLLIGGYIIYFMIDNYKKLFIELLAPACIVVIGTWFYRNYGYLRLSALGSDITKGIYWNEPLFLGFALLSVGVLTFNVYKKLLSHPLGGVFARAAEIMLLGSIPLISLVRIRTYWDFFMVFMMSIGIALSFANGSCVLAENRFVKYISRLTYPLYLNHNMFRILLPYYIKNFSIVVCMIYLLAITVYSMLTMWITDLICGYFRKCCNYHAKKSLQ